MATTETPSEEPTMQQVYEFYVGTRQTAVRVDCRDDAEAYRTATEMARAEMREVRFERASA